MSAGGAWRTFVGIDPGLTTGLVAITLPLDSVRLQDARLVGFATVKAGTGTGDTDGSKPAMRARLFHKIRERLASWHADIVVIEEPWDALPHFGQGKRGKAGHARGTLFTLGTHYGLALAAASDLPWSVSIASYPVTSAREKVRETKRGPRTTPERIGWMQRRNSQCPAHERVALEQALQLRALKERPADGVLPGRAALAREEDDNVYMSLGVLSFHLDRERGVI